MSTEHNSSQEGINFQSMKEEASSIHEELPELEVFDIEDRAETARKQNATLREITGYNNPNRVGIDRIIRKNREASKEFKSDFSYSDLFIKRIDEEIGGHPEIGTILEEALSKGPLVDLGGTSWPERVVRFAKEYSAKDYVGVDEYLIAHRNSYSSNDMPSPEPHNPRKRVNRSINMKDDPDIDITMVASDMLEFVSRMKDGSGNFIINGIDRTIIKLPEYHEALADEISRATIPGGVICGVNFGAYEYLLKRDDVELILPIEPDFDYDGKIPFDNVAPMVFRKK